VAADDLQKVQHPLVVLLLLTAGAALTPGTAGLWLFAPYVLFRMAGKLLGGWLASRIAPGVARRISARISFPRASSASRSH
jgi:hypothetical protein